MAEDKKNNTTVTNTVTHNPTESSTYRSLSDKEKEKLEQRQNDIRKSYGADNDGKISRDEKYSEPILGFNLADYRKEQEQRDKEERIKQRAAGWTNALALISDIVSASLGGNVYARGKDDTASKALNKRDEIATRLRGFSSAYNDAVTKREQDLRRDLSQAEKDAYAMYGTNHTKQNGGGTTTTQTTEYGENDPRIINAKADLARANAALYTAKNEVDSNNNKGKKLSIKVNTSATGSKSFDVDKNKADSFARSAISHVVGKYLSLSKKLNKNYEDDMYIQKLSNYLASIGISTGNLDNDRPVYLNDNIIKNFLSNGSYEYYKDNNDLMQELNNLYATTQQGQLFANDDSQDNTQQRSPWSLIGQQQGGNNQPKGGGNTNSRGYLPKDTQNNTQTNTQTNSQKKQSILILQN